MPEVRIGYFVEVLILETIDVDYFYESEVITLVDDEHIKKPNFYVPFVCGYQGPPQRLQGANTQQRRGRHRQCCRGFRSARGQIQSLHNMDDGEVFAYAKKRMTARR
ncbi:probable pyridoxal 5'-phosphate synthase subunit PDX1 [Dioscorea cayenensis subsp. rotundata]|uniref:Probable pyridoxal 5'-phosphate synthase subunit PDX1 n=1 Tax=Dioscorea cayennensis subsp. rotundata TaxID=55577 RepID=A0AB40BXC5_DIOCR|nr:probable pyridoxal 5'-phosphate synthase subunit PDX1 [Dioscorea cayenensis subsp. rotundata]